jgi:DNA-binding transcriptional MerR regulator
MLEKAPDAFRTISEVADDLDVPQHVLRFWESRFAHIKPMKRGGGRRYYRPEDIDLLRGIRFLLYGEGYTIRGVQRILKEQGVRFVQSVWQEGAKLDLRRSARTTEAEHAEEEAPGRGVVSVFQKHDAEQAKTIASNTRTTITTRMTTKTTMMMRRMKWAMMRQQPHSVGRRSVRRLCGLPLIRCRRCCPALPAGHPPQAVSRARTFTVCRRSSRT